MIDTNSNINKIYKSGLCLGCGLCEGVAGSQEVKMELDTEGFYYPKLLNLSKSNDEIIRKVCPSFNVINEVSYSKDERIWGSMEGMYSAYSTNKEIRHKGSSGGVISGLAISLLESNFVDAVLQVGGDENDHTKNKLRISKTRQEVLSCASSRYAPALIFNEIIELFESSSLTFCFIGKPCDVSALKNLLQVYPKYKNRIKLTVALICAGMPSFKATDDLVSSFKPVKPINSLVYRGNGWPGYFSFRDRENKEFKMSYNDSWGKVLGKQIHHRCKICPDGIGLQADIAVGDAWETKDGYPDFTEKEGKSLVLVRTNRGNQVLNEIDRTGVLLLETLTRDKLKIMQPYQYNRRLRSGIRVIAFVLAKGKKMNFKNLSLGSNSLLVSPIQLLKEFVGSFKRSVKL